jgi:NAD(P)-dependent dehydrogenase (short-subunit alcohol dehydrogenase family)
LQVSSEHDKIGRIHQHDGGKLMDLGLKGKVAVITGGSTGIGLAVARGLALEGVHTALCARDGESAQARATEIAAEFGVSAVGFGVDVTKPDDLEAFAAAVESQFGGVDIVISNAGIGSNETIMDAPDEKWQYYWDLHVMAAVRLARSFAPMMKTRGGGVILHNASICATQPLYYEPIYNTTKAALVMFSKCLAHELIPHNIRVNTINPGLILTAGWSDAAKKITAGTNQTWEAYLQNIADENAPIGRFASPEELANFFVFMCSDKASYCVGSSYYVDGGWLKVVN